MGNKGPSYKQEDLHRLTMELKTLLNPNATPFLPLSQRYSEVKGGGQNKSTEVIHRQKVDVPEESTVVSETVSCQKVDCGSVEYNIESKGELPVSDVTSLSYDFEDDAFLDETVLLEKHAMMDAEFAYDPDRMMEFLSCMFPDLSLDSLAASLHANDGHLDATIDMLEQLEDEGDIPEASNKDGSHKPLVL